MALGAVILWYGQDGGDSDVIHLLAVVVRRLVDNSDVTMTGGGGILWRAAMGGREVGEVGVEKWRVWEIPRAFVDGVAEKDGPMCVK